MINKDLILIFLLNKKKELFVCFSAANTSNSLIGMWVLQPSILELLAVRLIPQTIGHVSATLLYAQLYLLYSHCAKYANIVNWQK